jgi:DinB family protein
VAATGVADLDLRTAEFGDLLAARGWSAPERDFFADEAIIWARFVAFLDTLVPDDWTTPVAASAAGGPDWAAVDHIAHIAAWEDFGLEYVVRALDGEPWPTEAAIGDFDVFNEAQRPQWAGRSATDVRAWVVEARERLLPALHRVPPDVLRDEAVFGWCYFLVHGHVIEHLAWLDPWLRQRRGASA